MRTTPTPTKANPAWPAVGLAAKLYGRSLDETMGGERWFVLGRVACDAERYRTSSAGDVLMDR